LLGEVQKILNGLSFHGSSWKNYARIVCSARVIGAQGFEPVVQLEGGSEARDVPAHAFGAHGWFDKRFIYEESLQMPFLVGYPQAIAPGSGSKGIAMNVDFAPTLLDYAGLTIPTYIQGTSMRPALERKADEDWQDVA
jgi:arylsulfatase A-like enzyme